MAVATQTLCSQQFTNSTITSNGTFVIFSGSTIANNNALPGGRLVVDFSGASPLEGGEINPSYAITCILEGIQDGVWYPIAYQFEPFKGNPNNGLQRIVVLQPDISTYDAGIDDIVYVADTTIARISRQQGRVPAQIRLRILLKENGFGTANAFVSATIKATLELYD